MLRDEFLCVRRLIDERRFPFRRPIAVASLGQLKVVKVNYRGGGPSIPGNEDIVAVYRELLKTHKPKSIGMFGA